MKLSDGDSLIEQLHQIRTLFTAGLLEIMWEKKESKAAERK